MGALLKWTFLVCLALLPFACWNNDELDPDIEVLGSLAEAPRQSAADLPAFSVEQAGVDYRIEPVHAYTLEGLVVSLKHHDGDRMLHRLWNDHLNVSDLCVVWGDNTDVERLREFEFWSGQFTCFFRTRSDAAWRRFRPEQLSNNHLITEDPGIRSLIEDVRIGDQVHFEGYLARYGNSAGFRRGTSTSRDDTGNGACETVYVTGFQIMRSMDSWWRRIQSWSWFGMLLSGVGWLFGVARGAL